MSMRRFLTLVPLRAMPSVSNPSAKPSASSRTQEANNNSKSRRVASVEHAHEAKIDDTDDSVTADEVVARMRVGMEVAVVEHLLKH